MKPKKITRASVKELIWLARQLPDRQQLAAEDVDLIVADVRRGAIRPGVVITRLRSQDLYETGSELSRHGQRIAVLPMEIFIFTSLPGWVWMAMKQTVNRVVELHEEDATSVQTIPMKYPAALNRSKLAFDMLLLGRHIYGVTAEDIEELSRQLLEVQAE